MTGEQGASPAGSGAQRRVRSITGFVVGLLLLGAALWAVAHRQEQLERAWEAARGAGVGLVVLCLLLPLLNWLFTSAMFSILNGRYARIPLGEMSALIASAWLLNMLPLRPGLLGRVAYHKKVHGIRVRDSIRVLVYSVSSTGMALVVLLGVVELAGRNVQRVGMLMGVPVLALGVGAVLLARRSPRGEGPVSAPSHLWRLPAAVLARYLDMVVWGVRYWLVFRVLGQPVTPAEAAAITVAAQAAMMTPVQLGLREWVVGGVAALVGAGVAPGGHLTVQGAMDAATPGLMADVVMRGTELAVVIPLGFACTAWLWRRLRRAPAAEPLASQ